jgi:small subunit ribosomal protein S1
MTNQVTQDAEESATIEKTASEQTETLTAPAEAAAQRSTQTADTEESTAVAQPAPDAAPGDPVSGSSESEAAIPNAESGPSPARETPMQQPQTAPQPEQAANEPTEEAQGSNDIDFGAILEQFEQEQTVFHSGELVTGTVVGITDRGVLIDFGYKSEGFVPPEEFTGPDGEMTAKVGDTVEVVIRSIHSGEGAPQLSRLDALGRKVWDEIESAFQSETPITGRVVDKTKGGLRIDLNGIEAFLPGSQIDSRPIRGLDSYIGQDIEARIIKFSRRRNNIVLSRKVLTDEVVNVQKAETLAKIDVGYVVDGVIKNLTEYGAFVDIGGIDGLLHVTDMSWGRIHHPADLFGVGDHIQVKVLKLDREKEKVSLGYKQLLPDPWSTVVEVYPVNSKIKGTVSSVTEYGVFVELEPGVEGLVHVSEISWSRRSQSPKRMFHKGQEVDVQVLGVDTVEKRISLGMKQFQENPWDMVDIKYPVGAKVQGRVRNLTDFGAFVELEEGVDGLVHVSDISWAKKIKHPKDVLKKDQEVEAIVTSIDKRGQRLSLSMKDLTPSAWEGFVATHRPGDVVKGKVSRFTNFGVFVELGEGLEGLCHISELSDERVDRAESVAELGQEMDFKILRIEPADQKIGLSHRAVGKADEPVVDTKMYSTEAKGGMASLGELAKLRFGGDAVEEPKQDPEEKKKEKKAAKQARAEEFAAKEAEAAAAPAAEPEPTAGEAAETPAEETPAAEAPAEEAPAAETPAEEAPAAEAPAEETPAAEAPAEETPAAEAPAEETPAAEAPAEEAPAAETPAEEAPAAETPAEEAPAAETPVEETPAAETPTEEAPAAEPSAEETPAEESDKNAAEVPAVEKAESTDESQTDNTEETEKQSA